MCISLNLCFRLPLRTIGLATNKLKLPIDDCKLEDYPSICIQAIRRACP